MSTAETQKIALSSIHDFAAKLRQPDTLATGQGVREMAGQW